MSPSSSPQIGVPRHPFTEKGAPGFVPPPPRANQSFATFLILCPTSFFLGLIFSLFPYDYPVLWTSAAPAGAAGAAAAAMDPFTALEKHYALLAASPPLIPRMLHIVIFVGLLGFFLKLYRATESNMLFDGASLVLYVIGVVVYITNVVKGLRVVSAGAYGAGAGAAPKVEAGAGAQVLGREDSLRVLSASHTILGLVLVGVLVLQAGQWYAERKEGQDDEKDERARRAATAATKKRA